MGTHSIIVISTNTTSIYLWQHFDGYLEGVGKDLCKELQRILTKYSIAELKEMCNNIKPGNTTFKTSMLENVFTGSVQVEFSDPYMESLYEYVIDLDDQILSAEFDSEYDNVVLELSFDMIKNGQNFNHIYEESDE